jgi:hypothetical protein
MANGHRSKDESVRAVRVVFPNLKLTSPLHAKRRLFLLAVATHGLIGKAAQEVGVSRMATYLWRKEDPAFDEAVDKAKQMAAENIEEALLTRAVHGNERGIYYKGDKVDTYREYDTTAGIFLLKGLMPDRYKERTETVHDISPAMARLKEIWSELRDVSPPSRTLPAYDAEGEIAEDRRHPQEPVPAGLRRPTDLPSPPPSNNNVSETYEDWAMLDQANSDGEAEEDGDEDE